MIFSFPTLFYFMYPFNKNLTGYDALNIIHTLKNFFLEITGGIFLNGFVATLK